MDERSPQEVARILEERARRFAAPREQAAERDDTMELLAVSIGRERYGVETASVVEVLAFVEPAPVPCTPPLFLGVVSHRGRILPVIDLRKLFDAAGTEAPAWRHIVAVEAAGVHLGIAAEAAVESIRVGAEELVPPPVVPRSAAAALIRGVTAKAIAVLDVEALARDPRIIVNEEVR